jgi:CheY-like chemotaxis protein
VILGCVTDLQTLSPEGKPRELLTEVSDAVERASALTRQLLAFSRQEMLEPRAMDLNSVVLDAERMLGRMLGEDVALRVRLGRDLKRIKADQGSVTQVLFNLAVNARDALPKGGHLAIETRNVILDAAFCARHPGAVPGPHVLLALADNGIGMSDEVKARAFDPFFTTKGVGKGTGLGLSVTHGIVEQCGGHLELSSELNVGTEIEIYFPALLEAPVVVHSTQPAATKGSETIMVVEDDHGVRRVSVRILKGAGYSVIEAESAAQALQLYAKLESPIAMLMTDVVMPEMDGRQLAEALQARQPGLKVLYLSGYTDDAVVRYGVSHAEVEFLQKPFSPASLTAKVRKIFDGV